MPNFARGFKRLTWVVSILLASPWTIFGFADLNDAGLWFSVAAGAFGLTWVVFFAAQWIARGFSGQQAAQVTTSEAASEVAGASATASPRKCARCGFTNAATALRCQCGYGLDQNGRDEERHQRAKTNWIWPKITDEASAKFAVNEAVGYALFVTVVTVGIVAASIISGRPIAGFDAWNSLDVAFAGLIAFGLWKRSRVAAVVSVLYWFVSAGFKIADGRFGIITLLVLLGFIHGVRGTFALAKYRQAALQQTTEIPSPVVASLPRVCPRCGLTSPPGSARCDCGHKFIALTDSPH